MERGLTSNLYTEFDLFGVLDERAERGREACENGFGKESRDLQGSRKDLPPFIIATWTRRIVLTSQICASAVLPCGTPRRLVGSHSRSNPNGL